MQVNTDLYHRGTVGATRSVPLNYNSWNQAPSPPTRRVDSARLRGDAQSDGRETLAPGRLAPGVAGVGGLHSPEDFAPLARAAVMESNRLREAVR